MDRGQPKKNCCARSWMDKTDTIRRLILDIVEQTYVTLTSLDTHRQASGETFETVEEYIWNINQQTYVLNYVSGYIAFTVWKLPLSPRYSLLKKKCEKIQISTAIFAFSISI